MTDRRPTNRIGDDDSSPTLIAANVDPHARIRMTVSSILRSERMRPTMAGRGVVGDYHGPVVTGHFPSDMS